MNTTDIQASVSSLIESRLASDWRHAPNSYVPPPAFDSLVEAGDDAIGAITAAIAGAAEQVARADEDRLPTMFAIRDLMRVLARIDTPRSRSELVAFLNRSYPEDQKKTPFGPTPCPYWVSVRSYAIGALEQCAECEDSTVVEGLRAVLNAPYVAGMQPELFRVHLLARKFGGRIPLPVETTDIQASASALIESWLASDWYSAPKSYVPPPAFDDLVRAGDDAVEAVTKAITGAIDQAARGGEDQLPTLFAIRDLMTVLATIDTPRSRAELVAFLNRSYPEDQKKPWPGETRYPYWYSVQDYAIRALEQCGQCHDPEAVEGLRMAAVHGLTYREQSGKVHLLVRKFGSTA